MSDTKVQGSCLCGDVQYEVNGNLGLFQYCHCSRCRKFTGSAYGANLFCRPEQFRWLKGEERATRYLPEESKHFATCFCNRCGSSLPWLTKTEKTVVIPAGTLDGDPGLEPSQNLFCASAADWYRPVEALPQFDEMPPRKTS